MQQNPDKSTRPKLFDAAKASPPNSFSVLDAATVQGASKRRSKPQTAPLPATKTGQLGGERLRWLLFCGALVAVGTITFALGRHQGTEESTSTMSTTTAPASPTTVASQTTQDGNAATTVGAAAPASPAVVEELLEAPSGPNASPLNLLEAPAKPVTPKPTVNTTSPAKPHNPPTAKPVATAPPATAPRSTTPDAKPATKDNDVALMDAVLSHIGKPSTKPTAAADAKPVETSKHD